MKISEMTNDQATDAMIRISSAFSILCGDDEFMGLISGLDGKTWTDALKNAIPNLVKVALVNHKNELYEIVGALNAIPASDVGSMNFFETIGTIQNSYDEVLKNFFISSGTATKAKENA